jgi:formylglycine-generating enzyme required for sulfatase activity
VRGGSWISYPFGLRASRRNSYAPGIASNDLGFRVARAPF